jgi:hypothetical protein
VQAATGIDLEKDVVDNLTGEIVGIYDLDTTGAMAFGTRDDQRTQDLLRRLDGVIGGALASNGALLQQAKMTFERQETKAHGRPVYHYKMSVPNVGPMEFQLTTAKGALIWAFDDKGRERIVSGLGTAPSRFLDKLDPDVRTLFESDAPMVAWALSGDYSKAISPEQWKMMDTTYGKLSPELPQVMRELMPLGELLYDLTTVFDVKPDGMVLDYRVRLL